MVRMFELAAAKARWRIFHLTENTFWSSFEEEETRVPPSRRGRAQTRALGDHDCERESRSRAVDVRVLRA
jgi:hypothetical protein